jgi:putative membrane protein
MSRRLARMIPALAAALVVALLGAGSFAIAGDGGRHHHDSWSHGHGHGHGHGQCYSRVSGLDEFWLRSHIQTNLFEIAGGQAALERATVPEVRELAQHLVTDHTAALEQATAVAQRVGVPVPTEPTPLQAWSLRAVTELTDDAEFDVWFADLQVQGHLQAIAETEAEVARGCNFKVRRLAANALPVLQAHLEHARAALEAAGG